MHVDDAVDAILRVARRHGADTAPFAAYNVAADGVVEPGEFAAVAARLCGLPDRGARFDLGPAAAPGFGVDCAKIKALGWQCRYAGPAAVAASLGSLVEEVKSGRLETVR